MKGRGRVMMMGGKGFGGEGGEEIHVFMDKKNDSFVFVIIFFYLSYRHYGK